jgi:hypothetical protein
LAFTHTGIIHKSQKPGHFYLNEIHKLEDKNIYWRLLIPVLFMKAGNLGIFTFSEGIGNLNYSD